MKKRTNKEEGAATIRVTLSNGRIVVKHGDTGETLINRKVQNGFWSFVLWPTLAGKTGWEHTH